MKPLLQPNLFDQIKSQKRHCEDAIALPLSIQKVGQELPSSAAELF